MYISAYVCMNYDIGVKPVKVAVIGKFMHAYISNYWVSGQ